MSAIKIFGVHCNQHKILYRNVETALQKLDTNREIQEIDDVDSFLQYGITKVPALLINQTPVLSGNNIPTVPELIALLQKYV